MASRAGNRGVSVVLGSLLMISLAVAGGSLLYNYSINTVQTYEQPQPVSSLLQITTGSASGTTIRFFVLNLGKNDIFLNGADHVYVTTPNGSQYSFVQSGGNAQEVQFSTLGGSNSTNIIFRPSQTMCFIVNTPFSISHGSAYSVLVVLGDGSETVSTIHAN